MTHKTSKLEQIAAQSDAPKPEVGTYKSIKNLSDLMNRSVTVVYKIIKDNKTEFNEYTLNGKEKLFLITETNQKYFIEKTIPPNVRRVPGRPKINSSKTEPIILEPKEVNLEKKASVDYKPLIRLKPNRPYLMHELELETNENYRLLMIKIKDAPEEFHIIYKDQVIITPTKKGIAILYSQDPKYEKAFLSKYNNIEHTLEETGQDMGITRERVRQIENKALKKLRHPARSKLLAEYNKYDPRKF